MHKWNYTPTYQGFNSFYGYYDAVEDYYTHKVGLVPLYNSSLKGSLDKPEEPAIFNGLDFRNNTKPVWDKEGVYSTNLFT